MTSLSYVTVRGIPGDTAKALKAEARRRGISVNQLVKDLLAEALHVKDAQPRDNGLAKYSGTWSAAELQAFQRATKSFENIDPEVWE